MNPIISSGIVILFVVVSSIVVTNEITPLIEKNKYIADLNNAKHLLNVLDKKIEELLYEAPGAKKIVNLEKLEGEYIISPSTDSIKYSIAPTTPLFDPGTLTKEKGLTMVAGPFVKSYTNDIDADGEDEYILENDKLVFAVEKYGTLTNTTDINTSQLITAIKLKDINLTMYPQTRIIVDESPSTAIGTGFTELINPNNYLSSGSIRLVMTDAAGLSYEVLFTLRSGADFIEMVTKHIKSA